MFEEIIIFIFSSEKRQNIDNPFSGIKTLF